MDNGDHEPHGIPKMTLRVELEFLVQVNSDVTSPESAVTAIPSDAFVRQMEEMEEPQSPRGIISNRLREIGLSVASNPSSETGVDKVQDERTQGQDSAVWMVEVDENNIDLQESTWLLVRIRSPLVPLTSQTTSTLTSVCTTVRTTQNLTIGLNHLPRLRVEIKPNSDYTVLDLRQIISFLWFASPRFDILHAKYCGPGSTTGPGLQFSRLFSPVSHLFISDAEWRGEKAATVFTHGPTVFDEVGMLKTPEIRGSAFEELALRAVDAEDVKFLIEGTRIYAKDWNGKEQIFPGVYDFSNLLGDDDDDYNSNSSSCKGLIRFTQHAGTLDAKAIDNWAKVCYGIVDFCLNATEERIACVREQLKHPSSYTTYDLLDDINLPSQAGYYKSLGPNPFVPELALRHLSVPAVNLDHATGLSPYTFGIELEFLVPYYLAGAPDPHPDDPRWVYCHNLSLSASDGSASKSTDDGKGQNKSFLSTLRALKASESKNKDAQVYDANANRLSRLLTSVGHLSATFDSLTDHMSHDDMVIPTSALRAIADAAGLQPLYFREDVDSRHQLWHIHRDTSLSSFHYGEAGYAGHLGVEISSPILRSCPEDFERIFDVIRILRAGVRPMLDSSCGFHVHVGNVHGFSLQALKKTATLVWAAEMVLYGLVHPSREVNEMTTPLSKGSTLACIETLPKYISDFDIRNVDTSNIRRRDAQLSLELEAHIPMETLPQRLQDELLRLWAANSYYGIISLLQPDRGCKGGVSFLSIRSSIAKQPTTEVPNYEGTVEFRLLEGTLDLELMTYWTKLVLRIVEMGVDTRPTEYFRMISMVVKEYRTEEERLAGFLEALGLGGHFPFWSKVAERNKALAEGQTEGVTERKQWQNPVHKKTNATATEREAFMRSWYEHNIVRVPEVESDDLNRARRIL